MSYPTYEFAWTVAANGSLITVAISTLEQMSVFKSLYSRFGLLSSEIMTPSVVSGSSGLPIARTLIASDFALMSLLAARMVLCMALIIAVLVLHASGIWVACGTFGILATLLFNNRRCMGYGQEGSDQLTFLALAAFGLYQLAPKGSIGYFATGIFVVCELLLSYIASGVSKLESRIWRSGDAIQMVGRLIEFRVSGGLRESQTIRLLAAWGVMLFETTFPLALIDLRLCWAFLAGGLLFHLGVCVVMGFNRFFIAFVSCYPLVLWAAMSLHHIAGLPRR